MLGGKVWGLVLGIDVVGVPGAALRFTPACLSTLQSSRLRCRMHGQGTHHLA